MTRECRRCHLEHPLDRFRERRTGTREHVCRRCISTAETARQRVQRERRYLNNSTLFEPTEASSSSSEASPEEISAPRYTDCDECKVTEESSGEDMEDEDDSSILGSLYVMENSRIPSELKIGRSRNCFKRARQMSASHNFEMKIIAIFPEAGCREGVVHSMLHKDRVPGRSREFFKVSRKRAFSAISAAMGSFE